jgi:predicted ATP-binding protein involved in virulence
LKGAGDASSQFPVFFGWFREREDLENQERVRGEADHRDPQLQAVRSALTSLLPGWTEPRVLRTGSPGNEYGKPVFVVRKGNQELAFDQLSEGERSLAAMVCDIARRLAIANPDGDPLQGNGVVMIDEIDLHLHPRWQAEVLERLMATFPNLQWVVTTHSPIVLSRVRPESVRILDGFTLSEPGPTYGRDANALLEELFGIQLRPDNVAQLIEDIAEAIDEEELERARTLLDELAESLGTGDREVTRLRTMIDLLSA